MKALRIIGAVLFVILPNFTGSTDGQTLTNLYSFTGAVPDGGDPWTVLVQGKDGNFYGTSIFGGTAVFNEPTGLGTIFRMSPSGVVTTIYAFAGYPNDGANPNGKLVQGNDGNFYGVTQNGGNGGNNNNRGVGTVFRISPSGVETNLYSFQFSPDGGYPYAGLVQGNDGNLYGTTSSGGTNGNSGFGTVFRISPSGVLTTLHFFANSPNDGGIPSDLALVQGTDGNFYGTTLGPMWWNNASTGTIFRVSPSGVFSNLYTFLGRSNGYRPNGGLAQGSDGNFYGTTAGGGNTNLNSGYGYGLVFRISPSGNFTNLWSFSQGDGAYPQAGLVQGSDGNFYGTTSSGGTYSNGTIFRISTSGSLTVLQSINTGEGAGGGGSGANGLMQGSDGNFYFTTTQGGTSSNGNIFRISVPLNSPANQISVIHSSGTNIIVTIPSLAYQTYQLQFSSSMNPTNWVNIPGASVTNCIGGLLTLTNFGGALSPQGFYRFDITP